MAIDIQGFSKTPYAIAARMSAGIRNDINVRYLRTRARCWSSRDADASVIRTGLSGDPWSGDPPKPEVLAIASTFPRQVPRCTRASSAVVRHHGYVSTDTKERPDTTPDETTEDDTPKFFHYVKKDKIAESAVMGTHVVALCGEVFPVTRSPKPGSPVCPECKKVYEGLRRGGE
jgi:Protein of unknown function (DUF3039)